MTKIVIFGSSDCPSWEQTREVQEALVEDDAVPLEVKLLDPNEHEEEFRELGLTICPSIVVGEEVISVGPPSFDYVKEEILKRV